MRVLLIKTSSMGDLIHTLPAISDAMGYGVQFSWVVEEDFSDIPTWHPAVTTVLPVALRRWRRTWYKFSTWCELGRFWQKLRANKYDLVLDCQGLCKSALISLLTRSKQRVGFAKECAREPIASYFYNIKIKVAKDLHIVAKLKTMFATALGYSLMRDSLDYSISRTINSMVSAMNSKKPYLLFFHGTTWQSKHWPLEHWAELINIANKAGFAVAMTWAGLQQKLRVQQLCKLAPSLTMLPHLSLDLAKATIASSVGVVAVDTGFAHLAIALNKPTIMLFGPSDPKKVGPYKTKCASYLQSKLSCVPCGSRNCKLTKAESTCMQDITPPLVWCNLEALLEVSPQIETSNKHIEVSLI